jgi:hypothetical protein
MYQKEIHSSQDTQGHDTLYPRGAGDILLFKSPQGYEVRHRFANGDKITLNGIDYQVKGNQLYAIGAQGSVMDGDQLIRYRNLKRGLGVRFSTPLKESELSLRNDTLSINQLTLRHLSERTLIYFGEQAFPLKALQDTVHRHRQRRDLSRVDVVTSAAQRPTPWTAALFKDVRHLLSGLAPWVQRCSDALLSAWWSAAPSEPVALFHEPPTPASANGPKSKHPYCRAARWDTLKGTFRDCSSYLTWGSENGQHRSTANN